MLSDLRESASTPCNIVDDSLNITDQIQRTDNENLELNNSLSHASPVNHTSISTTVLKRKIKNLENKNLQYRKRIKFFNNHKEDPKIKFKI